MVRGRKVTGNCLGVKGLTAKDKRYWHFYYELKLKPKRYPEGYKRKARLRYRCLACNMRLPSPSWIDNFYPPHLFLQMGKATYVEPTEINDRVIRTIYEGKLEGFVRAFCKKSLKVLDYAVLNNLITKEEILNHFNFQEVLAHRTSTPYNFSPATRVEKPFLSVNAFKVGKTYMEGKRQ